MRYLFPYFFWPILLLITVQHDPFFWDTVQLASKHAHFFYENNLAWQTLPPEIDSGHPPCWGYYLAWVWKIFGKNLVASHWATLPFSLGIVGLLWRLGRPIGNGKWAFWLLPIVLLDPVLAGQMAMVSPDIALVCFFLMVWVGIAEKRGWLVGLGVLGLCLISMRGMMTAGAMFIYVLLFKTWMHTSAAGIVQKSKAVLKNSMLWAFAPGLLAGLAFLYWHQMTTGWIGFHPNSPWSPAFERVGWNGLAKNVAVLGWRWLDFGRVGVWIILSFALWQSKKQPWSPTVRSTFWFGLVLSVFLLPSALLYQNLSAHRYFLPLFLAFHVWVFTWVVELPKSDFFKKMLLSAWIICMASGNLWRYPIGISMDWDATLAHLPYHAVREKMMGFIKQQDIALTSIGTAFPNINSGENLLLNGDQHVFDEKKGAQTLYVLWSDVFNDFSKENHEYLQQNWILMHEVQQSGVTMRLFKRP